MDYDPTADAFGAATARWLRAGGIDRYVREHYGQPSSVTAGGSRITPAQLAAQRPDAMRARQIDGTRLYIRAVKAARELRRRQRLRDRVHAA